MFPIPATIAGRVATPTRGTLLIALGLVLVVGTLASSAVLAEPIGDENHPEYSPRTLVGSHGGGPGWHEHGSVYLLNGTDVVWRESTANSYFDVTITNGGQVLAGFMHGGYPECGPYDPPCSRTGYRVIDSRPTTRVVSEYSFPVRSKKNSEVHDVEPLDSGAFLMTDMDRERIFAVENGTVIWEWTASSFYDGASDPTGYTADEVPVLSHGVFILRAIVPATPYWFRELHLGVVLLSIGLVAVGILDRRFR